MAPSAPETLINPSSTSAATSSETQPRQPIWLRCEKKPYEHRSALTPTIAKTLIDNNFEVFVERDPQRIFDDAEFEACVHPIHSYLLSPGTVFTDGECTELGVR